MLLPLLIERPTKDLISGADSMYITGLTELMAGKHFKIKFKDGIKLKDLVPHRHLITMYLKVLYRLLELMLLDVAEGHTVYLDKKRKSRFFVVMEPASQEFILGKGWDESSDLTKIDLKATGYSVPKFAFDPGYKNSTPTLVSAPRAIWSVLIENANKGKKYGRPTNKKFSFERTPEEKKEKLDRWKNRVYGKSRN